MLSQILKTTINSWNAAITQKEHPFRFFSLTTVSKQQTPKSRMVVLRGFDQDQMTFTIFTDERSQKVKELAHNNNVQLLFYDSTNLFQAIVSAKLVDQKKQGDIYASLPDLNKKDYSSTVVPGEKIPSPESISHDFEQGFFTELSFQANTIELLRLKRPNHIRCLFKETDGKWLGNFLAP